MKLSTRGRYGTRLMLELTRHYGKGPVSMAEISRRQNIPVKYLEQLIIPLKRAQLITSVRGKKGGHMLARAPDKINIWDVLLVLESKMSFVDCLTDQNACENTANCPIRPVWGKALASMIELFSGTTLDDVLAMSNDQ